jgi:hypothetical protein
LAEFLTNPGPYHLVAVDHCIRYLHAIRYLALKFDASGSEELTVQAENKLKSSNKHVFEASVDASYANEKNRRSDEGYTFKLFDELIDWAARKQATISTFTIEAELLAMLHAGKEFI